MISLLPSTQVELLLQEIHEINDIFSSLLNKFPSDQKKRGIQRLSCVVCKAQASLNFVSFLSCNVQKPVTASCMTAHNILQEKGEF